MLNALNDPSTNQSVLSLSVRPPIGGALWVIVCALALFQLLRVLGHFLLQQARILFAVLIRVDVKRQELVVALLLGLLLFLHLCAQKVLNLAIVLHFVLRLSLFFEAELRQLLLQSLRIHRILLRALSFERLFVCDLIASSVHDVHEQLLPSQLLTLPFALALRPRRLEFLLTQCIQLLLVRLLLQFEHGDVIEIRLNALPIAQVLLGFRRVVRLFLAQHALHKLAVEALLGELFVPFALLIRLVLAPDLRAVRHFFLVFAQCLELRFLLSRLQRGHALLNFLCFAQFLLFTLVFHLGHLRLDLRGRIGVEPSLILCFAGFAVCLFLQFLLPYAEVFGVQSLLVLPRQLLLLHLLFANAVALHRQIMAVVETQLIALIAKLFQPLRRHKLLATHNAARSQFFGFALQTLAALLRCLEL